MWWHTPLHFCYSCCSSFVCCSEEQYSNRSGLSKACHQLRRYYRLRGYNMLLPSFTLSQTLSVIAAHCWRARPLTSILTHGICHAANRKWQLQLC